MTAIKIDGSCKQKIRHELRTIGIHEGTLLTDLDNQSLFLKRIWSYDKN